MAVDRSTSDGTDSSGDSVESGLVLEVTPNDQRGGWEVIAAGSREPLYFEQEIWEASARAIDHLSENGGGEVVEWSPEGRMIGRQSFAGVLSREEILARGREICEAEAAPLVGPGSAIEFDVPGEELEFAAALWRVCGEPGMGAWKETDLGFAFQYGPYVLLNRDSGRLALEEYEGTAAAMRRYRGISRDDFASTQTGLLVVKKTKVTNYDGGQFTLHPGDLLQRGSTGNYAAFSSNWVEVVQLTKEKIKRLRPVLLVKRDLTYFFISPEDAFLFEDLTGKKFLET